jgi:hypothetical protein
VEAGVVLNAPVVFTYSTSSFLPSNDSSMNYNPQLPTLPLLGFGTAGTGDDGCLDGVLSSTRIRLLDTAQNYGTERAIGKAYKVFKKDSVKNSKLNSTEAQKQAYKTIADSRALLKKHKIKEAEDLINELRASMIAGCAGEAAAFCLLSYGLFQERMGDFTVDDGTGTYDGEPVGKQAKYYNAARDSFERVTSFKASTLTLQSWQRINAKLSKNVIWLPTKTSKDDRWDFYNTSSGALAHRGAVFVPPQLPAGRTDKESLTIFASQCAQCSDILPAPMEKCSVCQDTRSASYCNRSCQTL